MYKQNKYYTITVKSYREAFSTITIKLEYKCMLKQTLIWYLEHVGVLFQIIK